MDEETEAQCFSDDSQASGPCQCHPEHLSFSFRARCSLAEALRVNRNGRLCQGQPRSGNDVEGHRMGLKSSKQGCALNPLKQVL